MDKTLAAKNIIAAILDDIKTRPILATTIAKAGDRQIEFMLNDWQNRIEKVLYSVSCSDCSNNTEHVRCSGHNRHEGRHVWEDEIGD